MDYIFCYADRVPNVKIQDKIFCYKEDNMKGLVSFVLAAGLSASSLCAVDSKTLSQSDKEFLFASNEAKTQVLSDQEMSETQGEFWGTLGEIALGIVVGEAWEYTKDKGWWAFSF